MNAIFRDAGGSQWDMSGEKYLGAYASEEKNQKNQQKKSIHSRKMCPLSDSGRKAHQEIGQIGHNITAIRISGIVSNGSVENE